MESIRSSFGLSVGIGSPAHRSLQIRAGILLLFLCGNHAQGSLMQLHLTDTCNDNDLKECAVAADALVKDPSLVFPDSPASLDRVCKTWDQFLSCIYNFTKKCYTKNERARFDQSFKKPIMSMSTLCKDQAYRQDYLVYAPCIKTITTDGNYCGFQYQMLIDQISNSQVGLKQLCCARSRFKKCIMTKTIDMCEPGKKGGLMERSRQVPYGSEKPLNVTAFSIQVLDKSLAFIAQQCSSLREEECQGLEDRNQAILRPNSKGPLTNAEAADQPELQSAASNEKRQPATSPQFQIPPKTGGAKNSQSGSLNSLTRPSEGGGLLGLSPKGTEQKRDRPEQNKLSATNPKGSSGSDGHGEDANAKGSGSRKALCGLLLVIAGLILSQF